MKNEKGYVFVDIVIFLCIIAMIFAVLIPVFARTGEEETQKSMDIYSGISVVCFCDDEEVFHGLSDNMPDFLAEGYILVNIEQKNGYCYLYYIKKEKTDAD